MQVTHENGMIERVPRDVFNAEMKEHSHDDKIMMSPRSGEYYSKKQENYWWGMRTIYYNDYSARTDVYKIRTAAQVNVAAAFIYGALLGGVGALPNGLTSAYAFSLADCMEYNANLYGNGIWLDINYFLIFTSGPRR